jgi:hypothetical protein
MAETYKGEAYCVKCKEKRQFEGIVNVSDSGRRMAKGKCPVCGTTVNRILGKAYKPIMMYGGGALRRPASLFYS